MKAFFVDDSQRVPAEANEAGSMLDDAKADLKGLSKEKANELKDATTRLVDDDDDEEDFDLPDEEEEEGEGEEEEDGKEGRKKGHDEGNRSSSSVSDPNRHLSMQRVKMDPNDPRPILPEGMREPLATPLAPFPIHLSYHDNLAYAQPIKISNLHANLIPAKI